MSNRRNKALALAAVGTMAMAVPTAASGGITTKTSGNGESINISWTEYDPDDLLGLPGNVHVGYLYVDRGPYGTYIGGNVTDFDCDEGELPWGGHGVGHTVVDEVADAVIVATEDAIEAVVDTGGTVVDGADVVQSVQDELAEVVTDTITDEVEEGGGCDYIQDRYLSDGGSVSVKIDSKKKVATVTGRLDVSNGGHGEPGSVLGSPPIDLTITGGDWEKYEYSSSVKGIGYSYSNWQEGTSWYGGQLTGSIGAMGFADDADDESYTGFSTYRYRTVDRVR